MGNGRGIALDRALLALRVSAALFLLQWGIEKFVVPSNTPAIWSYFYGLTVPQAAASAAQNARWQPWSTAAVEASEYWRA